MRAMTRSISGSQHGAVTITKVRSRARFHLGKRPSGSTRHRLRSNRFSAETPFRDQFTREWPFIPLWWPFPFDPFDRRREASTDLTRSFDFISCAVRRLPRHGADRGKLPPLVDFALFRRRPQLLALVFIALLTQSSAGSDDGSVFRIAAANTLFYCQKCFLAIG